MTKDIPFESPLHRKLVTMLSTRIKLAKSDQTSKQDTWNKAEDAVLAYVPETELDAQRRRDTERTGTPHYTTIKIPYTYAVLMAAHTYVTSVFFGRTPIHQFSGRHGESEEQVSAIEALIAYQVETGEMTGPYYIWIYDGLKYGVGILEEYWEEEEIQSARIAEEQNEYGVSTTVQVRTKIPGYQGNRVCNISPFDFYPDPRVTVGNYQKGEFCAVRKRISWETIIKRKAQGYYMNIEKLDNRTRISEDENQTSSQLERPDITKASISYADDLKHPSIIPCFEVHVGLIPQEWGLGTSDFPEKWVFTITADYSVIIGAQPHGALHGRFPFAVIETEVEGYGRWNRGLGEVVLPVQNTMDWLLNTHFYNVRASMNNQFIIDPSKIVAKDAKRSGPGFIWRLRPEAYGQDIRTFVHQIPVVDMTRGHVQDLSLMLGIGERITGINDQIFGVLQQGGRKTATEVRTSTGFGVNRLKTIAEYISATAFSQHSQRLVQNSQQYYDRETKLKIVGDLAQTAGPRFMTVTSQAISGFFDFVPVDGTLPIDRLAQANMWKELLMQMRNVPGLMQQYDLGKLFGYVANLTGVRNMNQFRIQVGSPQALMQQAEAGNVVPIGTRGVNPTRGGSIPTGVPSAGPPPTAGM